MMLDFKIDFGILARKALFPTPELNPISSKNKVLFKIIECETCEWKQNDIWDLQNLKNVV